MPDRSSELAQRYHTDPVFHAVVSLLVDVAEEEKPPAGRLIELMMVADTIMDATKTNIADATDKDLIFELARRHADRGNSTTFIYDGMGRRFRITYMATYSSGKRQYTVVEEPWDEKGF